MKKFISILLVFIFLLTGCKNNSSGSIDEPTQAVKRLMIASMPGVPSIVLLPSFLVDDIIVLNDNPSSIREEFNRSTPNYDIIVAPIEIGLSNENNNQYKLHSIVSWGSLYIIGNEVAFNNNQSVGIIKDDLINDTLFQYLYKDEGYTTSYYEDIETLSDDLIGGDINAALLPEPTASLALSISNEENLKLTTLKDLSSDYSEKGFPCLGLFVLEETYNNYKDDVDYYVKALEGYHNGINKDDPIKLINDLQSLDYERLGFVTPELAVMAYERMHININEVNDHINDINKYCEILDIKVNDSIYITN